MLKIKYKGISYNAPLDETTLEGKSIKEQALSAYIQGLKAGRLVKMGEKGVALATADSKPLGFLVNDADGYFYENKPALASRKVAVLYGDCIVETDQLVEGTYKAGDLLYIGADGCLTATAGEGAAPVAIALSEATPTNLVLEVARI